MTDILITRFDEVTEALKEKEVVAVLSIEYPGAKEEGRGVAPRLSCRPQKIICFWDSEQKVHKGPDKEQIKQGLDFMLSHLEKGPVLVHCHAGKSRSVALALGAMAARHPEKSPEVLIEHLLKIRPQSAPNILMIQILDDLTGRKGSLIKAVLEHPVLTEQRKQTEENRQRMLKSRPDLYKKLYPEKFGKP